MSPAPKHNRGRWLQYGLVTLFTLTAAAAGCAYWASLYLRVADARRQFEAARGSGGHCSTAPAVCVASKRLIEAECHLPFADRSKRTFEHLERVVKLTGDVMASGGCFPPKEHYAILADVRAEVREANRLYGKASGARLSMVEIEALSLGVPKREIARMLRAGAEPAVLTHQ